MIEVLYFAGWSTSHELPIRHWTDQNGEAVLQDARAVPVRPKADFE